MPADKSEFSFGMIKVCEGKREFKDVSIKISKK